MPVQHTLLGRPMTIRAPPRRFQAILLFLGLFIFLFTFFRPPSAPYVPPVSDLHESINPGTSKPNLPSIPTIPNLFGQSAHRPPTQENSTSGDISWYNNWKWKLPFSSTVTLDENLSVLPPLPKRPPIYTFYDDSGKRETGVRDAENELVLLWRRAWWAQGFNPIVLGVKDAMTNPLYETLQRIELHPSMQAEVLKWLAWGHMGSGILANWLAVPMAPYDDPFLLYLRRGEYPRLERYKSLENGLYTGEKDAVNGAIQKLINMDRDTLNKTASIIEMLDENTLFADSQGDSIAYYHLKVLKERYQPVAIKIDEKKEAEALNLLTLLINSHLHTTWQNSYPEGISLVQPYPESTQALIEPAIDIARNLSQCPTSPLPESCPPIKKDCTPCKPSSPMKITLTPTFKNESSLFTIGTVPHPYTMTSLRFQREKISAKFLRNDTGMFERDAWVAAIINDVTGQVSGESRIVTFKDAVAGPEGSIRSLWLTAERETHKDLNWLFGFSIPGNSSTSDQPDATGVPAPAPRPPAPKSLGEDTPKENIEYQKTIIAQAREAIKSTARQMVDVIRIVEEWNLADTEAWRFARAYSARRRVERLKWEEEEKKFIGAENRNQGWGRWLDNP